MNSLEKLLFQCCSVHLQLAERKENNVANPIKVITSDELNVNENAWHYRFYQWWQSNGGHNKPAYRENLCHYMRVVLLWVPLFWSVKTRYRFGMRPVYPVMIGLWSGIYYLLPDSLHAFWVILSLVSTFYIGIFFLFRKKEAIDRFIDKISPPLILIWESGLDKAFAWFFKKKYWHIRPFMVATILLLAVWGMYYPFTVLKLFGILGATTGAGAALVGILLLAFEISDKRKERRKKAQPNYYNFSYQKSTSSVKLAGQFVMAKKRKICPFINLPQGN